MTVATPFSGTYAEARDKFLGAATAAGAHLSSYAHPERGPDGGGLTTDCAWIGPADARAVVVLVSGTHGVEGHCGSGAQVDWLRRGVPDSWERIKPSCWSTRSIPTASPGAAA